MSRRRSSSGCRSLEASWSHWRRTWSFGRSVCRRSLRQQNRWAQFMNECGAAPLFPSRDPLNERMLHWNKDRSVIVWSILRFLVGNKSFWSRFDKRLRFFFLVQINLFQDFSTTKCHFSWFHVLCQNTKIEFWFCCYSGAFDHISWSSSADSSFVCEHLKNFLSSLVLKLS